MRRSASPKGWHAHFVAGERAGYSGVGVYSRVAPDRVESTLNDRRFDTEGRVLIAHFGRLAVATVYFPKGTGKERDNSRVPYKLDFYDAVFDRVQRLKRRGPVFVIGDYNTAHQAIDLARPKTNEKTSGFLPEERAAFSRWTDAGWVDTFRALHPDEAQSLHVVAPMGRHARKEHRLADRLRARVAHRPRARVRDAFIWKQVLGSDHCPVGVDID